MTDYFCPPPPFKPSNRPSHSTAGDTNIPQQQWIWSLQSLKHTPSQKQGMSWQTESHERSRAVYWMVQAAISLALPQIIIATAATYLHRFYMRKSLQKYPTKEISATAFFLATKVEEVPRKLEYVVKEYLKLGTDSQSENSNGSEDPKDFERLKHHILYYEDILLRTLCFDLAVDHPYLPLIHTVKDFHVKCLEAASSTTSVNSYTPSAFIDFSNSMKARSMAQSAWSFVNDSLMTTLCITTNPSVVAAAAFLIALSHRAIEGSSLESDLNHESNSIDQNDPQAIPLLADIDRLVRPSAPGIAYPYEPWWKSFGAETLAEVHDAANTILEQYNDSVAPRVLKQVQKIPGLIRSSGSSQLWCPTPGLETEAKPDIDIDGKSDIGATDFKSDIGGADAKSDIGAAAANSEIGTDIKPDTVADYATNPTGLVSDDTTQPIDVPLSAVSNTENLEPSTTPLFSPAGANPIETSNETETTTNQSFQEESIRKRPRTLSEGVLSLPSPNKHIKTEHPITTHEDLVFKEDQEVDGELASSDMQIDMKMSTPGSQDGEEMKSNQSIKNEVGEEKVESLNQSTRMEDGEVA